MVALQLVGMAQCAVHPVGAVVPHHMLRGFPLALPQPVAVKAGHHVAHRHLEQLILQVGQADEAVVAPQDLAAVQVEHQHGQGRIQHIAGAGGVQAAADAIQILPHAVLGHPVAPHAHIDHQRGHHRLGNGQHQGKRDGGDDEGGQTQAVQHDIGAEAADQLFTQGDTSFQWEYQTVSPIGIPLQFTIIVDYSILFPLSQQQKCGFSPDLRRAAKAGGRRRKVGGIQTGKSML